MAYGNPDYIGDRIKAVNWAKELVAMPFPAFILDTETTGLVDPEIVDIALIDLNGNVVLDTLVKCPNPDRLTEIGKGGKCAADIHGIYPDMLVDAPSWEEIGPHLEFLTGSELVIYNAPYDWPVMERMNELTGISPYYDVKVTDAMYPYAMFVGQWNIKYGNYKWQPLPAMEGVQAHRALADCLSTLNMIQRMAEHGGYELEDAS